MRIKGFYYHPIVIMIQCQKKYCLLLNHIKHERLYEQNDEREREGLGGFGRNLYRFNLYQLICLHKRAIVRNGMHASTFFIINYYMDYFATTSSTVEF